MIRIRGKLGDWPVDLQVELDAQDWAQLAAGLVPTAEAGAVAPPAEVARASAADDPLWQSARQILQQSGALSGPQLLRELEPLAGSVERAKRLLVRLRHSPQVRIEQAGDEPLYRWVD